jgi:phenylalanyl-tRNA synthetase alpha chain
MPMLDEIKYLSDEILSGKVNSEEELETFRLKYLSKKGLISELFEDFRNVPAESKKEVGQKLNELKQKALEKYNSLKTQLQSTVEVFPENDLTKPAFPYSTGSRHPISIVRKEIIDIFSRIGFIVSEGPEIEDDNHVFTKLNFAPEHPAVICRYLLHLGLQQRFQSR